MFRKKPRLLILSMTVVFFIVACKPTIETVSFLTSAITLTLRDTQSLPKLKTEIFRPVSSPTWPPTPTQSLSPSTTSTTAGIGWCSPAGKLDGDMLITYVTHLDT